jgi:hypothetical protein
MNDARKANYDDFKALFQVNLMQQHGLTPLLRRAMELVKDNKVVRFQHGYTRKSAANQPKSRL